MDTNVRHKEECLCETVAETGVKYQQAKEHQGLSVPPEVKKEESPLRGSRRSQPGQLLDFRLLTYRTEIYSCCSICEKSEIKELARLAPSGASKGTFLFLNFWWD